MNLRGARSTILSKGALLLAVMALAACSSKPTIDDKPSMETTGDAVSTADSIGTYQAVLAQRIMQVNSTKVFIGRPQPLLRSVIVVKFWVDANGSLVRSEVLRTNRDRVTEATALASIKATAPFPKPAPHLLKNGHAEVIETWLFNNDGRFQLRTLAEKQMDQ